jgi:hypothetical protein
MSKESHVIVYIPDEEVYGEIISQGAFASTVRYSVSGVMFEVLILNEDFDIVHDISIEIEEEY